MLLNNSGVDKQSNASFMQDQSNNAFQGSTPLKAINSQVMDTEPNQDVDSVSFDEQM